MVHIGLDLHHRNSYIRALTDEGELVKGQRRQYCKSCSSSPNAGRWLDYVDKTRAVPVYAGSNRYHDTR